MQRSSQSASLDCGGIAARQLGCATRAKPAKAGDAKLRGYSGHRDGSRSAMPVEPPNHTSGGRSSMQIPVTDAGAAFVHSPGGGAAGESDAGSASAMGAAAADYRRALRPIYIRTRSGRHAPALRTAGAASGRIISRYTASAADAAGNLRTSIDDHVGRRRDFGLARGGARMCRGFSSHARSGAADRTMSEVAPQSHRNRLGRHSAEGIDAMLHDHIDDDASRVQERCVGDFLVSTRRIGCS
jgi:hypothetical protein